MADYRVRRMMRAELDLAIDWAAQEGWNPGLSDAACFHAADPDGFLLGLLDGEPIASISVVRYGPQYGFLGFYIVREPFRGSGCGLAIWRAGMAQLGDRVVGLDGVPAQQQNYGKSGFVLAHRNVRFGGIVALDAAVPRDVIDLCQVSFPEIAAYDARLSPAPREVFLRPWLSTEQRIGRALVREGRLAGYGVIRHCREGWKIGPLFADDAAGAEALFGALASAAPGETLYLDVPEPNAAALALAERHGLTPRFETARMYRGAAPALPLEQIFGITTFELG